MDINNCRVQSVKSIQKEEITTSQIIALLPKNDRATGSFRKAFVYSSVLAFRVIKANHIDCVCPSHYFPLTTLTAPPKVNSSTTCFN